MKYLAIYLRLSLEDEGESDESNSICNQRKQIYEYIHHNSELSAFEVMEFCDDGYSGTNMERPAMQRLLKAIKTNNVFCIMVKDMSRFSRDYIEMGTYLNQIFPFMGIRFIAINDHYDSVNDNKSSIEIDTAFQTLLYDLYSKDISIKVKASFENKCARGEYMFGQVPFGYKKSKEAKHTVIINEKEAQIVQYIFSLAMQGKSSTQIAKQLYTEKIPTIMQMRKPDKEYTDEKIHSWSSTAIRNILNNRFYLGEMMYGKSMKKSVGSKGRMSLPRKDWKIIPNHHEALISEEVYQQVSLFKLKENSSTRRKREKHPLTGKLFCGGCAYSLSYKPLQKKNHYRRFECSKHSLFQISECCTYLSADAIEEIVLFMLNRELLLLFDIKQQEHRIASQMEKRTDLKKKSAICNFKCKQAKTKQELLYERYALAELTEREYQQQMKELSKQATILSTEAAETASQLKKSEEDAVFLPIERLTQTVVDLFIKKIYVSKYNRIEIEWNFAFI